MAENDGDPVLHELLVEFAGFFDFDEETRDGFLDGAAGFYMVLKELAASGRGYGFPIISEGAAGNYVDGIGLVLESSMGFYFPAQDKENTGDDNQAVGAQIDREVEAFELEDLYEENPDFKSWFMKLSPVMRMGALQVYRVKRIQMEIDRIRKLSGFIES
jgi:hypothetical protein